MKLAVAGYVLYFVGTSAHNQCMTLPSRRVTGVLASLLGKQLFPLYTPLVARRRNWNFRKATLIPPKIQMSEFTHLCPLDVIFEYEIIGLSVNNFKRNLRTPWYHDPIGQNVPASGVAIQCSRIIRYETFQTDRLGS